MRPALNGTCRCGMPTGGQQTQRLSINAAFRNGRFRDAVRRTGFELRHTSDREFFLRLAEADRIGVRFTGPRAEFLRIPKSAVCLDDCALLQDPFGHFGNFRGSMDRLLQKKTKPTSWLWHEARTWLVHEHGSEFSARPRYVEPIALGERRVLQIPRGAVLEAGP